MTKTCIAAAALAAACLASACGSDSTGPSNNGGSGGSGGGSTNTTTITITANGVSPRDVTVAVGSRVTFVNNDNQPHDMASDPHPEHTLCNPELNVGFIQPNQSGITQNLTRARVCTYHDHNQPSNTSLQGTIRIQ
jgi:plastocyanin